MKILLVGIISFLIQSLTYCQEFGINTIEYWYLINTNCQSSHLEKNDEEKFQIFKIDKRFDTITNDSIFRKTVEYSTGKVIRIDSFKYEITEDHILNLISNNCDATYFPFKLNPDFKIKSIMYGQSYGSYRNNPNLIIIDSTGIISELKEYDYYNSNEFSSNSIINYPISIENKNVKKLSLQYINKIKNQSLEKHKLNHEQLDSLNTLIRKLPLNKMTNHIVSLSNCDDNNHHLRIYYDNKVMKYDSSRHFEQMSKLIIYLSKIYKERNWNK